MLALSRTQLMLLLVVVMTVCLGALLKNPKPSLASMSGKSVVIV